QVLCDGEALTPLEVTRLTSATAAERFNLDIVATTGNLGDLSGTGNSLTTQTGQNYPFTISGNLTNNTDALIVIEYRVTPTLAGCDNGDAAVAEVRIEPTPVAAISNDLQTLCNGTLLTSMNVTNEAVHDGTPTFDMAIVATTGVLDSLTATGNALDTQTGQSYPLNINGTLTNSTDDPIVIEYRVTPLLSGCDDGDTEVAEITIEPTPRAAISNDDQLLCDGGTLTGMTITPDANPTGTESFDLAIAATTGSLANLVATGNALDTQTDEGYPYTINGTLTNNSNSAITIEYSVTPRLDGCTNGPVTTATVTVEPTPEAAITNDDQTLCNGEGLTDMVVSTPATHDGTPTFNLAIVATTGNIGNLAATGNALDTQLDEGYLHTITGTLTNNTDAAIVIEYRVTPLLAGCDNGDVEVAEVTIEPTPKLSLTNTSQAICNGISINDIDISNIATHADTPTFTLDIAATTGSLAGLTATGNALITQSSVTYPHTISGNLTNTTFAPIVIEYRATPELAGCTDGDTKVAEVTIYPTPTADPTPLSQTIPNAEYTDILMDGDVAGTLFGWRVLNAGSTNAVDGSGLGIGDRLEQQLSNNTGSSVTVTYRIGPSANGCLGDSVDVTVTVDPFVDMTVVNNNPVICSGGSSDILVSSSVTGTTFSWTVTDSNGLGATGGTDVGPSTGFTIQD
ncbi:MAG: hypothetical protein LC650_02910, partial [Actinobacteria bacterium]|nr:hypothetical protein [Actinomycetota bacterium]